MTPNMIWPTLSFDPIVVCNEPLLSRDLVELVLKESSSEVKLFLPVNLFRILMLNYYRHILKVLMATSIY